MLAMRCSWTLPQGSCLLPPLSIKHNSSLSPNIDNFSIFCLTLRESYHHTEYILLGAKCISSRAHRNYDNLLVLNRTKIHHFAQHLLVAYYSHLITFRTYQNIKFRTYRNQSAPLLVTSIASRSEVQLSRLEQSAVRVGWSRGERSLT